MAGRPRALFFGTPEFAVPCLDALVEIADVIRVISQPDRPAGRGLSEQAPPVKVRALALGIAVIQPIKVRTPEFAAELRALEADFALVVAYGRILPASLLQAPRRGCVNVHASLLPRWRGAAPIQWAIAEGDRETGVSLMEMDEGLDTGAVFAEDRTPIGKDETSAELAIRLREMGARLVQSALPKWFMGELAANPQPASGVTLARILTKEDGHLDFAQHAGRVHDRVRAMQPWPGASATWAETNRSPVRVKLHRTRCSDTRAPEGATPGTVVMGNGSIDVVCGESTLLSILEIQQDGRKRVSASEYVLGRSLSEARLSRIEQSGSAT